MANRNGANNTCAATEKPADSSISAFRRTRRAAVAAVLGVSLAGIPSGIAHAEKPAAGTGPTVSSGMASRAPAGATTDAGPQPVGPVEPPQHTTARRGTLLWAQPIGAPLTAAQVRARLAGLGFDTGQVRGGVALWRLVYATVDVNGRRTTASGLVALPSTARAPLASVLFEHGTLAYRGDAPSTGTNGFVMAPSLQAAGAGFAGIAPDYLGLGYGPGPHPYVHVPSEVTASVDMLAASRELLSRTRSALGRDLYVTGFSQGGPAALAVARELHRRPAGWRVRAVAPVAGPYDIVGEQIPGMLSGAVPGIVGVYYTAYALTAYDKIFDLYARPKQVFRTPYAGRVETLFNSNVPEEQIIAGLPASLEELLTPAGMDLLTDRHGRLARALKSADATCDWRPTMPVRLYVNAHDEQVPAANTRACVRDFRAKGANVPVVHVPVAAGHDSAHLGSGVAGSGRVLAWFSHLARE